MLSLKNPSLWSPLAYLNGHCSLGVERGVSPEDAVAHYLSSHELSVQSVAVGIPDIALSVLQSLPVLSTVDGPVLKPNIFTF